MYGVNLGELHASAASAALSLGEPQRALEHFNAAFTERDPFDVNREPRGAVIYLARQSEAHVALGNLDAAVDVARQVAAIAAEDADSKRSAAAFADMCNGLRPYVHIRAVADFLESCPHKPGIEGASL
jgi:tetratricopeptide (TPR) repeat protein